MTPAAGLAPAVGHGPILFRWNFVPHTWFDALQIGIWFALLVALVPFSRRVLGVLQSPALRRRALLLAGLALLARLVVPLLPFNWYSGLSNVDLGGVIWTKQTTYMPFPNQLITFTLGFYGILTFNIAIGVVSAVLAWHVTRRAGYGETVAAFVGIGLAITPMYVRLSSSDSTHVLPLPLFLLAAVAIQRVVERSATAADYAVLFCAPALACPIRIEAGLVMPSVIFLVCHDRERLRAAWAARRGFVPFAAGLSVGTLGSLLALSSSWTYRLNGGRFNPIGIIILAGLRAVFVSSVWIFPFVPMVFVFLAWFYIYSQAKRRDWGELCATVGPYAIFSIPFAYTGKAIAVELPSHAYSYTIDVFLIIAAAKGAALLLERVRSGAFLQTPARRWAAGVIGTAVIVISLWIPYQMKWAYMEEFRFLTQSIPKGKVRIATIWDPTSPGGDFDCCLALPYPTFIADFPEAEWLVLTQADAENEALLRDLQFDYYYRGSLVGVDIENINSRMFGMLPVDPEMNARQQAPLRTMRRIDEIIRRTYSLVPVRSQVVEGGSLGFADFPNDRVELVLYERRDPR